MATSGKSLFLEAMKLDESNELLLAASKYLEALLEFGHVLLESVHRRSIEEIQSKTFGDQTKAALQCLDRVYVIHQHYQPKFNSKSSPDIFTLAPTTTTTMTDKIQSTSSSSSRTGSPQVSPPTATLRHTAGVATAPALAIHGSKTDDIMAMAVENNKRLIAQFHETIRRKQEQMALSDVQVAHMETELQRKMTENLAIAEKQQNRLSAIPPGNSNTLPRGFGRKVSTGDLVEQDHHHDQSTSRLSRKRGMKKFSHNIAQWATLGPHDTLALGITIGDRWRSKSGDRLHTHDHRLSSESSLFEESEFANLLNDGDSDNEVPPLATGSILPTIEEMFGVDKCAAFTIEQKKQQQVIVELIYTERTHVRSMKVLQKLFYQPLSRSNILPRNFVSYMPITFLELVFANLDEIVELHTEIGKTLKAIAKEGRVVDNIGTILSKYFDGDFAEKFKKAVAQFCEHQQFALEQLELRRQHDSQFAAMLKMAENHPACHGFHLRDMIPMEMQRLSKYPLFFERLSKYADPSNHDEIAKLEKCHSKAQEILTFMNSRKRDFENSKKLAEINSKLDTIPFYRVQHPLVKEFSKFNIQKYGFIFEGSLRMRRMDNTVIEMHGVLCEEILLLLTKRGLGYEERLRLQFHEENVAIGARQAVLVQFCPIIKLVDAKLKDAATCDKDFYIICTSGEVSLYHLTTPNPESKLKWMKLIQNQINKLTNGNNNASVAHQESTEEIRFTKGNNHDNFCQKPSTEENNSDNVGGHPIHKITITGADDDDDADFAEFSSSDDENDFQAPPRNGTLV